MISKESFEENCIVFQNKVCAMPKTRIYTHHQKDLIIALEKCGNIVTLDNMIDYAIVPEF